MALFRILRSRLVGGIALTILLAATCASAAGAVQIAQKTHKKALSLSTITWVGPSNQSFTPELIAESKGYFQQQGITNSINDLSLSTPATWVAILLAGNANFNETSSSVITAVQTGAPLRAIGMPQTPYEEEIDISASFAAAHNIPSKGNSVAQAIAQFKALKGTHIRVAVSNITGTQTQWLIVLGQKYGMSVGINAPNDDINIFPAGSATNASVAVESGKEDAAALAPPRPTSPIIVIPMYKIPPANLTAGDYDLTTISMIQNHPDTVQAVVTAMTEAIEFLKTHPQQSFSIVQPDYVNFGYTTSDQQTTFFHTYADVSWLMFPTRATYNEQVYFVNASSGVTGIYITLPYQFFVVSRFAATALKELGLKY